MIVGNVSGKDKDIVYELNREITLIDESSNTLLKLSRSLEKGYSITKNEDFLLLEYGSCSDLGRGLLKLYTLDCIVDHAESKGCIFEDFGIMLDVSRNAVLNIETLKKMLRISLLLGYTFVGLYLEDTLQIDNEPYWGYQRGRYTRDEIKIVDDYARSLGIELRPFIQTLAHVNQVTRYEEYGAIIDTQDILLVGEKRTAQLLDNIISTVSSCFSTSKINIGMDEAYLVGRGRYIEKNGYHERSKIMKKHLKTVLDICRKNNLSVQMWSDMFFGFAIPEKISGSVSEGIVPEDVQICYWDYYSQDPAHYEDRLKTHLKLTDNVAFAGGAWKWSGLIPHNRYSIKANEAAMNVCKKYKIKSYTITCWGDNGAEASSFSVLPAIYEASNTAYDDKLDNSAFRGLTGINIDQFLMIDDVNPYTQMGDKHNNSSKFLLYNDPLFGTFDSVIPPDYIKLLRSAKDEIIKLTGKDNKYAYIFKTAQDLLSVLELKATLGIDIRRAYRLNDKKLLKNISETRIPQIISDLKMLHKDFRTQWLSENKMEGLEIEAIRTGGLITRLEDVKELIDKYIKSGEKISILDDEQLDFGYFKGTNIESLNYNLWSDIVSPNVIG